MLRRTVIGEGAEEEIRAAKRKYAAHSSERADDFLSELRVALRAVQDFPLARGIQIKVEDMEIRRVRIARFPYFLFYFVYSSFDTTIEQEIDVIYVLACRHERQGEPPWTARDPFRI